MQQQAWKALEIARLGSVAALSLVSLVSLVSPAVRVAASNLQALEIARFASRIHLIHLSKRRVRGHSLGGCQCPPPPLCPPHHFRVERY